MLPPILPHLMGLPLTPGQHGSEILDLRRRLSRWQRDHGIEPALEEGDVFDDATAAVTREFQRQRNLPADAEVGPETWQALVEANYALGDRMLWHSGTPMRGDDVLDLQQRLNQLGFDAGMEDGIFGPSSRAAVMEFQANVGLDVDGIVGARTLEALQRLHRGHQAAGVSTRVREEAAVRRIARQGLIGLQVMVDATRPRDRGDLPPQAQDVSWEIATRLAGHLGARGARPVLSRGRHQHPTSSARAQMANRLGVDLIVSIGLNTSTTTAATGCAAYYFGSLRFVSAAGNALAESLLDSMLLAGLGPDCRAHPMTWTLLRETRMPAVVIEPGFATSPEDLARLTDPAVQDRLARQLTAGIRRFLEGYDEDPLVRTSSRT